MSCSVSGSHASGVRFMALLGLRGAGGHIRSLTLRTGETHTSKLIRRAVVLFVFSCSMNVRRGKVRCAFLGAPGASRVAVTWTWSQVAYRVREVDMVQVNKCERCVVSLHSLPVFYR
jgi:hypothetical protein